MKKFFIAIVALGALAGCAKNAVVVTASFTTNKDVYHTGEPVQVKNTSTVQNNILAFCDWEYGDSVDMAHTYSIELEGVSFASVGTYFIKLTAYAEQGAGKDTYIKKIRVTDDNDIPWANFECPAVVKVGEDVIFEDKSIDLIGTITKWHWNFDGIISTYQSPRMNFSTPVKGMNVTLKVTDAYGASDTITKQIDVIE